MSKKGQKALASATIMSLVLSTVAVMPVKAAVTTDPAIAGSGRVETSIAIAEKAYATWTDSTTAVIANGADAHLVDSLAVAPLAYQKKAPILLTLGTDKVEQSVIDELAKHSSVKNVYLVGAVPASAKAQLEAAGYTVTVLQGTSRYETASKINAALGTYSKVAVVSGTGLADALSIASIAAKDGMAIELTDNNKNVPTDLDGKTAYTIGGTGVVTKDYGTRLSGANRLATNAAVIDAFKADLDFTKVYVANSANNHLVDALAGSVLAAQSSSPIVLVDNTANDDLEKVLTEKKSAIKVVTPLGGQVSTSALGEISAAINGTQGSVDVKADSVTGVKAIANNKVEVSFKSDATPDANAGDYTIVEKGTTTALKVSDATLEGTKVVLTTDAMTAGKAYTLAVGAAKVNFTGIAKVTGAPEISSAKGTDTNTIEVQFKNKIDKESATLVDNYTIDNGVKVTKAELNSDRDKVTLTAEGLSTGKTFKLTVKGVKSIDGVTLSGSVVKYFSATVDNTAPKLQTVTRLTNNRIRVKFYDAHGLNDDSANKAENYSISDGTNALAVKSVKAIANDDGIYDQVEIVTDTQKSGTKYTLTVKNLTDDSVSKNAVAEKGVTATFYGLGVDNIKPEIQSVRVKTNTSVIINVYDASALSESVDDVANYTIDGLTVQTAKVVDADNQYDADGRVKQIELTTDAMTAGKTYKITINNVADEFGNVQSSKTKYFTGVAAKTGAPVIEDVTSTDSTHVKVTFDRELDEASAEDPTNYDLGDDLGKAVKATLSSTNSKVVTLVTASQDANTTYTLEVTGVKDLYGNTAAGSSKSFIAVRTSYDTDGPSVEYVEAVNKDEVRIHLDKAAESATGVTVKIGNLDSTNKLSGTESSPISVKLADDGKTLVVPYLTGNIGAYGVTNISGLKSESKIAFSQSIVSSSVYIDAVRFVGNTDSNVGPAFSYADQTDIKTFKVHFDENIALKSDVIDKNSDGKIDSTEATGLLSGFTAKVSSTDKSVLVLTSSANIVEDKSYDFNFSGFLTDYVGAAAKNEDGAAKTTLKGIIVDTDGPQVNEVKAVDNQTVKITYSEDVSTNGSYVLTYVDENGKQSSPISYTPSIDGSDVILDLGSSTTTLKSKYVYSLKVSTAARDLANNLNSDENGKIYEFGGNDVAPSEKNIIGVSVINANTISFAFSDSSMTTNSAIIAELDSNGNQVATTSVSITPAEFDDTTGTSQEIYLGDFALLSGVKYRLTANNMTKDFVGVAEDKNIQVVKGADGKLTVTSEGIAITSPVVYKADASGVYTVVDVATDTTINAGDSVYVVIKTADLQPVVVNAAKVTVQ